MTFVSIISRHISGGISQNRVGRVINESLTYFIPRPALFHQNIQRPKLFTAASTISSQSLASVTSASRGTTRALSIALFCFPGNCFDLAALAGGSGNNMDSGTQKSKHYRSSDPRPPPVTMATRSSCRLKSIAVSCTASW